MEFFDFTKILETDLELYKWLRSLTVNGIATITGVPESEWEARKIADRVGFIRKTHYGEEFMVKAKDATSNVAYLSANLQMHTDLPYYEYVPGVNLLHCLVQSKSGGAQNLLIDGFYVADKLKREHPKEYKLLSTVLIDWSDIGEEDTSFHSLYRAPMICTDYDGNFMRINHSIPQRDSLFSVPLEDVQEWYKALSLFIKIVYDESVMLKTDEGGKCLNECLRMFHDFIHVL
jgi:gamma-butyrobetaine dioxygenase